MIKIVIVSAKAGKEIRNIIAWYDEQAHGLNDRFIKEFDYCVHKIQKYPETYKIVENNIHRCLMKIFPYVVFFAVTENEIIILRIRHKKQKQLKRYK